MTDTEPYRLEHQVGYLLRLATQRHTGIFADIMIRDLTPTQFSALVRLSQMGQCSQNHLGRMTAMDAATIKGVIDRLYKKGLVALNPDPEDRRRTSISLTDEAQALVRDLHNLGALITEATLEPLNAQEREDLLRLLEKIT